jgi:hypothetical protein
MAAGLITDRIFHEQKTASDGGGLANLWTIILEIRKGTRTNKFI